MCSAYVFSLPTKSDKVPAGSEWIQEIKYDGYRSDGSARAGPCATDQPRRL
jgi:ATP-dependent DNA ligase